MLKCRRAPFSLVAFVLLIDDVSGTHMDNVNPGSQNRRSDRCHFQISLLEPTRQLVHAVSRADIFVPCPFLMMWDPGGFYECCYNICKTGELPTGYES